MLHTFLLETAATDTTGTAGSSIWSLILPFAVLIAVFYFMIIRPQRKKDKEMKHMLEELKVGDNITTIGGMCGKVTKLRDEIVTVEVGSEKTELVFEKWAIKTVDKPVSAD